MSKFTLDVEYDFDFILFGISCHEKDYRISWALREKLDIDLCRGEDLVINPRKAGTPEVYAVFEHFHDDNDSGFFLVSNRCETGFLIPEHKSFDYFLIVRGAYDSDYKENILKRVREIPFILAVHSINPATLKSRQNLIF
ncbi:MAG: IPExxxVDY family protein [Bacteroidia bacterium]